MKKKHEILISLLLIIAIFSIGYYLRAYIPLHKDLPYSPYEAFTSNYGQKLLNTGPVVDYTDKQMRYPTSYLLAQGLNPIFGNFYIIYLLATIVIFFLGKEIASSNLAGLLAVFVFAISHENLLQYIRTIKPSGLCYVLMWSSLLFFTKYLKSKKNHNLMLFILSCLLALTSYHTGATTIIILLIGLLASLIYSRQLNKKILSSIVAIIVFYVFWVKSFDPSQFATTLNLTKELGGLERFILIILALILITAGLFLIRKVKILQSRYLPLVTLIPSTILIFSPFHFFQELLSLGVKNYYSSAVTLNNYLAQVLLTHIYIFPLLPTLFKKDLKPQYLVWRGWLLGLLLISGSLIFKHYYARIFDYTFPLAFILFGLYWAKRKKFRTLTVAATIVLLIISQIRIYNDPFSMRRYYNQNEIESAQKIILLKLNGKVASDLRTSALFSYLGKKDVAFGKSGEKLHDTIFYEHENLNKLNIKYVILSESMKTIVYATNFETTPVKDKIFKYYASNFRQVYNDSLMHVYRIRP